jgi:hypothetical protein
VGEIYEKSVGLDESRSGGENGNDSRLVTSAKYDIYPYNRQS